MLKLMVVPVFLFISPAFAQKNDLPLPEEIMVKGGSFYVGTVFGDEQYGDNTNVSRDSYLMMATEVPYQLYKVLQPWALQQGYSLGDACNGGTMDGCRPDDQDHGQHPAVNVTWWDAILFANALSERQGLTPYYLSIDGEALKTVPESNDSADIQLDPKASGYHLPGFVEWHVAARGGLEGLADGSYGYSHSGSQQSETVANFPSQDDGTSGTLPVASKRPNALGLYDMSGNAAEWLGETNHYAHDPSMSMYYFCGGSFQQEVMNLASCDLHSPGFAMPDLGFRLMRTAND